MNTPLDVSTDLLTRLRLVLLPGQRPVRQARELYLDAYACWHLVWSEAFRELGVDHFLASDNFTRQDLVTALFLDGRCVGLTLMRFPDSDLVTLSQDSYFSNWRPQDMEMLQSKGSRVVVCSHFTLHAAVRRHASGINFKSLLAGLASRTFFALDFDVMTGAMRRSRNVHKSSYEWGARPIAEARPSGYGDEVDLVGVFKALLDLEQYPKDLRELVENLWRRRLCLAEVPWDQSADRGDGTKGDESDLQNVKAA